MFIRICFLTENQTEAEVFRTYSFYKLVLEELNVGEEDRRGYPEDFHSLWLKNLGKEAS